MSVEEENKLQKWYNVLIVEQSAVSEFTTVWLVLSCIWRQIVVSCHYLIFHMAFLVKKQ